MPKSHLKPELQVTGHYLSWNTGGIFARGRNILLHCMEFRGAVSSLWTFTGLFNHHKDTDTRRSVMRMKTPQGHVRVALLRISVIIMCSLTWEIWRALKKAGVIWTPKVYEGATHVTHPEAECPLTEQLLSKAAHRSLYCRTVSIDSLPTRCTLDKLIHLHEEYTSHVPVLYR